MYFSFGAITTPIGVDIGIRAIKAVQLESRHGKYGLVAATTFPRTPSAPLDVECLHELAAAMRRQGFRGSDVVVACPPGQLHSATLELPPAASGAPLEKIAEVEIRRACKLDDSAIEMAWWDLPVSNRHAGSSSVMAVASTREATESIVSLFEPSGLNIVAVDSLPSALARACAPMSRASMAAVVDLGAETCTVALVHGGRVVYQRGVSELGIDILRRAIMDELRLEDDEAESVLEHFGAADLEKSKPDGVSPPHIRLRSLVLQHVEAIGRELESSLAYAAHRYPQLPVTEVFLAGGGARIAEIDVELSSRLKIATSVVTPFGVARIPSHLHDMGTSPRHMIALGLAMDLSS